MKTDWARVRLACATFAVALIVDHCFPGDRVMAEIEDAVRHGHWYTYPDGLTTWDCYWGGYHPRWMFGWWGMVEVVFPLCVATVFDSFYLALNRRDRHQRRMT